LIANGLATEASIGFVKQEIGEIAKGLPSHVKKFMNFTTNIGARVNKAIGGADAPLSFSEWKKQNEALRLKLNKEANEVNNTNGYNAKREADRVAEAKNARELQEQYEFFSEYGFDPEVDNYRTWKADYEKKNKVFLRRNKAGQLFWQPINENAWDRINEVVPMGKMMSAAADVGSLLTGVDIPDPTPYIQAAYNGFEGSGKNIKVNPRLLHKYNEII